MRIDHLPGALVLMLGATCCLRSSPVAASDVVVNGAVLDARQVSALTQRFGMAPAPGHWWYDARSGAFGPQDGPMAGVLQPGLELGHRLAPDASGGGDGRHGGVFINGREIHPHDIAALHALLGQVIPGRYWVDADGSFGAEGGPPLGNLHAIARARMPARDLRSSAASTCGSDYACQQRRSWSGSNSFSDGATGCIVMDGEITC
jgi:hypothetical protein